MKNKIKVLIKLFFSTFYLSAFTFGGGYVIVPLMQKRFVDELKWIEKEEMLDLVAISQASPGAIAINASIAVGYKVAGVEGVIFSVCGSVFPPFIIITIISFFYMMFKENTYVAFALKGMGAAIAAVIADAVVNMAKDYFKNKKIFSIFIMFSSFFLAFFMNINVVLIILFWLFVGVIFYIFNKKIKSKGKDKLWYCLIYFFVL